MKYFVGMMITALTAFSEDAFGYLMYGNYRIDQALYHDSDTRLVAHCTITRLYKRDPRDSTQIYFFDGPEVRNIDVHVNKVILGKTQYESTTLNLAVSSFMWPDDLVTEQVDHELLLILQQSYGDSVFYIQTVIPCVSASFKAVSTKEQAQKLLAKELVKVAIASTDVLHVRAVLQQLGPVLLQEDAESIVPFLAHEDVWVKRAAVAALVYATENDSALRIATQDLQHFISTTDKDSLIKDMHPDYHYAPYPFYKNYLFFLQSYCWEQGSNWSPEQTDKDCRIVGKMLALGILDKKTIRILQGEF